jgi:hypothetical protein
MRHIRRPESALETFYLTLSIEEYFDPDYLDWLRILGLRRFGSSSPYRTDLLARQIGGPTLNDTDRIILSED